ncbi:MAG: hypothetical protein KHY34_11110 [Lachnospiraceae bacterium]|nr:hypothetical protein [Lachnospiraceae bacterium]
MLALLVEKSQISEEKSKGMRDFAGILSVLVLIYMMSAVDGYSSFLYRGGQGMVSLLAVLVIYSLLNPCSILNKVLGFPILRWIGERSYGIFR